MPSLINGLRNDNSFVRATTISSLQWGWPLDDDILQSLDVALMSSDQCDSRGAENVLQTAGIRLGRSSVPTAEAMVSRCSCEPAGSIIFIAYYYVEAARFLLTSSVENWERHMLWAIENMPWALVVDSAYPQCIWEGRTAFYDAATKIWQKHIESEPRDWRTLLNGAAYFRSTEPKLSIRLLHRALALGGDHPMISIRLFGLENEEKRNDKSGQVR